MQVSRLHRQGAHRLLTSLQRVESVSGNFSVAASRLEIEEPAGAGVQQTESETKT